MCDQLFVGMSKRGPVSDRVKLFQQCRRSGQHIFHGSRLGARAVEAWMLLTQDFQVINDARIAR